MEKSKVYFTKNISGESLVKLFELLNVNLGEKVAIKVHSGEMGNQNFLRPEFYRKIVRYFDGRIVECNTAYDGARNTAKKHKALFKEHGWNKYFSVDLSDEDGYLEIPIENGKVLKKNYIGKNLRNYDGLLVISHFKGHPMGGYGGALKQLSIGCASSEGKAYIHSAGRTLDQYNLWNDLPPQDTFLEAMADAASSVAKYFNGRSAYINVMVNMSVDCDCCDVAEDPCLEDMGILASLDPIAIDQACLDLVYNSNDKGKDHFIKRVESRHGIHTIEAASLLGFGQREYELIEIEG